LEEEMINIKAPVKPLIFLWAETIFVEIQINEKGAVEPLF